MVEGPGFGGLSLRSLRPRGRQTIFRPRVSNRRETDELRPPRGREGRFAPYYVELNRGLYDDPTWWAALDQACRERGWRCEQRDILQDACEYLVVDAKNSDVGLVNIELGTGVVRCELTGTAAAENAPLLTDFLRHRTRLQLEATGRIEGESRTK